VIEIVGGMPFALLERVVDADGDVRRLLLDRSDDPARLTVEAELPMDRTP